MLMQRPSQTPSIATRVADVIVRGVEDSDSEQVIDLINDIYGEYQGCVLLATRKSLN